MPLPARHVATATLLPRRILLPAVLVAALLTRNPADPDAARARAAAAPGDGSVTDPYIAYVGRWDAGTDTAVAHWAGAYLRTAFTGTTVKAKARHPVNLYAGIDGGPYVLHAGVRGTAYLTPRPLARGTHTLRVAYHSGDTVFRGLVLDPGARTVASRPPAGVVEFVGDSITLGALTDRLALDSYAWRTGEPLGMGHTRIARSGYCLVGRNGCTGQAVRFFRTAGTGDRGFSRCRARAVVVNLGTNDAGRGVSGPEFQAAYTAFLRDVRARYPDAALFAMQTLKKRFVTGTRAAVAARRAAGDAEVECAGTAGWLTEGVHYEGGGGHPNEAGHARITERRTRRRRRTRPCRDRRPRAARRAGRPRELRRRGRPRRLRVGAGTGHARRRRGVSARTGRSRAGWLQ